MKKYSREMEETIISYIRLLQRVDIRLFSENNEVIILFHIDGIDYNVKVIDFVDCLSITTTMKDGDRTITRNSEVLTSKAATIILEFLIT